MADVTDFSVVRGGGTLREPSREVFFCPECQSRSFKFARLEGGPILVECANCECRMNFFQVTYEDTGQ